jgi:uncharacterized protein YprB with RNaseH-like and TPR domain
MVCSREDAGAGAVGKSSETRKRLEDLNRAPLPSRKAPPPDLEGIRRKIRKLRTKSGKHSQDQITFSRDLPRTAPPPPLGDIPGETVLLEEHVSGSEVQSAEGYRAYCVEQAVADAVEHGRELSERFRNAIGARNSPLQRLVAERCGVESLTAHGVIFLDLETTGLGSSPLFLIGSMSLEETGLVVRQYLARDYAEERTVISLFSNEIAGRDLMVSFNGKSFDLPYLRVRAAATGMPRPHEPPHLDLLHAARRIWGKSLPDCRLQTLESRICGRFRSGDIPGCQIPEAYHSFVRTGNAARIVTILEHNMLDLITLADLMTHLSGEPGER